MKIIISGSSGFIGAHLVMKFSEAGHKVLAMQRHKPKRLPTGVEFQKYELANLLDVSKFHDADYLIHAAYQPYSKTNQNSRIVNYTGTQQLIAACKAREIKIIFLSTMSAHDHAESSYGQSKFEIEKIFNPEEDLVLKLGLVLGRGGVFYKIVNAISQSKFVPVIASDKLIQTVTLEELFGLLEMGMKNRITGMFAVGEAVPVTLIGFYKEIAAAIGVKSVFVPVPLGLIQFVCSITESLGIILPFTTENLLGLKKMRTFETQDLSAVFDCQLPSYDQNIASLQMPRRHSS